MPTSPDEVTPLLRAWNEGDQAALGKLIPLVDRELRMLADGLLRREPQGHILETTALINETFIRLIERPKIEWQSRTHFFAIAARSMRRILIEDARHKLAKRRDDAEPIKVSNDVRTTEKVMLEVIALDEALSRLATFDERKSAVIELRYFGGLTSKETAEVLQVSEATVEREWRFARSWLKRELALKETPKLDVSIPIEEFELSTISGDAERTLAEAWSNRALVAALMSNNWAGLKLLVQFRLSPIAAGELVSALGLHTSKIDSLLFKLTQYQVLEKQHNVFTLTNRGYVLLEAFEKAIGKNLNE